MPKPMVLNIKTKTLKGHIDLEITDNTSLTLFSMPIAIERVVEPRTELTLHPFLARSLQNGQV